MRKLLLALLLALVPTAAWAVYCGQFSSPGGVTPPPNNFTWASQVVGTCHYWVASSGGNDSNTGLSPATAFATLPHAQSVMQGNLNAAQKNVCLTAGSTFTLSGTLVLGASDANEVWQFDSRGNGDTATIAGGGHDVFQVDTDNITINGLVINGCFSFCIHHDGATIHNLTVENSDICCNTSFAENGFPGLIHINGVNGVRLLHNYVHDGISQGTALNAFQSGLQLDNVLIDSNVVLRTCLQNNDCGGIYQESPQFFVATNYVISNNFVRDIGDTQDAHDLYFDLGVNGVRAFNNILGPVGAAAANNSAGCLISDGFNNQVFNNICDLGGSSKMWGATWWYETPPGFTIQGLTWTKNIVLASFAGGQNTNAFGGVGQTYVQTQGTTGSYNISGNWYHNYAGGTENTSGTIASDTSPIHIAAADLRCSGYLYGIDPGSLVIPEGFTTFAPNYGPPNFVIPTSNNHSCP